MRREERAKSIPRAVKVGLVCLVPALSLLLSLLIARPAQAAGQLNMQLEAEAGVRSDGNYAQRTTPVDPTGSEPLSSRQQSFGRGGFNLNLSYVLRRWELAMVYSPFYEAGFQNRDFAGLTHRLNLSLSGNLSARTTLRLSERLLSSPTLELFGPTLGDTVVSPRTGRQLFQDFDAEIDSDLTRRTVLFLGADEFLRTFKEPGLVDSRGAGGAPACASTSTRSARSSSRPAPPPTLSAPAARRTSRSSPPPTPRSSSGTAPFAWSSAASR